MSKNGKRQLAKSSARMVRGFLHQYFEVSTLSYRLALQKNGNAKYYGEGDEERSYERMQTYSVRETAIGKPIYEWNTVTYSASKATYLSFPTNHALISWDILPDVLYVQLINAELNNMVILTYYVNLNRHYQQDCFSVTVGE